MVISRSRISNVKGKQPLDNKNEKKFRSVVEYYREDIVTKWIAFFVYNKEVQSEIITKKLD